jgi:hypothetical protein
LIGTRLSPNIDELVRRAFSRKDAKNAKKKSFNQMALRPLRLGVTF